MERHYVLRQSLYDQIDARPCRSHRPLGSRLSSSLADSDAQTFV